MADTPDNKDLKFLLDPYIEWTEREGVPVTEELGVDLLKVETKPWPRFDASGALVHLKGRGDFVSIFVIDIAPGGKTAPQRHLFEEVIYVLSGHGSTTVQTHDGKKHSFEWGPKSLFALPLNAHYQHFNGSGTETARFASVNNLCIMLNLFHNEGFIFDNPIAFPDREGAAGHFSGEGEFIPIRPGRNMWETNFVPDLADFGLKTWEARGAGSSNMKFILADGTMHAHSSEMPVGTYKKGHRHGADFHVFAVNGHGFSLLWYDSNEEFQRIDWQHGVVFAPPDQMFHQHYNTSTTPSRYLAVALGSMRYPFVDDKRQLFAGGVDTSVTEGGNQVEYEDQDPRIHGIWLKEIEKNGIESRMGDYIDETPYVRKTVA